MLSRIPIVTTCEARAHMQERPRAETPTEARVERIVRKLRQSGRRVTPQRFAIVRAFVGRDDHPSAEAILEDIRQDFPMVAASTVYDTLHALVELGEAAEVAPAGSPCRFDPNTHDHCHMVCLVCNAIMDVPLEQCHRFIDDSILLEKYGFRPALHLHQVTGVCRKCRDVKIPR